MGHYEKRLEADINRIRSRVTAVGSQVAEAVEGSVRALLTRDLGLASEVVIGDLPINREIRDIDRSCHAFVARHLPSAGHLRFVSSVLRMNVAIERIGDYAVTIGRETHQLDSAPAAEVARDVSSMGEQARSMLDEAIRAFTHSDADLARSTKALAKPADNLFARVYDDLLREGEEGSRRTRDLFALLTVFNALERVTDQAKNICEETLFALTGETKAPKTYRILFVDERNDGASQLAEAFARKAFPSSGIYASAGWTPAQELAEACRDFMEEHGYAASEARPVAIDMEASALASHHVIVSLGGDPHAYIEDPPFRTVLLKWDVGATDSPDAVEACFREVAIRVRDLMETLRGSEAD